MRRHAWLLVAATLIAGPVLAAEPPAATDSTKPPIDNRTFADRLDQIEQSVKRMDDKLRKMDESMTRLVEQNAYTAQKELADLRDLVSSLRKEMGELRATRVEAKKQDTPATTVATNGTVILSNEHPYYAMDAVVNGVTHHLLPNSSQTVTAPIGSLSVQVLQTDSLARVRTMLPGETKIITMR